MTKPAYYCSTRPDGLDRAEAARPAAGLQESLAAAVLGGAAWPAARDRPALGWVFAPFRPHRRGKAKAPKGALSSWYEPENSTSKRAPQEKEKHDLRPGACRFAGRQRASAHFVLRNSS